jgi:hypothetical protein
MNPYLEPQAEFYDRTAVPPEIQEPLDEWREMDPGTARLIWAAVMSRDQRRLRQAWQVLAGGPSWRGRSDTRRARRRRKNRRGAVLGARAGRRCGLRSATDLERVGRAVAAGARRAYVGRGC